MVERLIRETTSGGTVSEHTYQRLLSMIVSKELQPGQVVEERPLSQRMNISRTPMRMALSRLLGEGMIDRLSNGLLVVREIGIEEFFELVHLRTLLEGEAARLAAGKIPEGKLADLRDRIRVMAAEGVPDRRSTGGSTMNCTT